MKKMKKKKRLKSLGRIHYIRCVYVRPFNDSGHAPIIIRYGVNVMLRGRVLRLSIFGRKCKILTESYKKRKKKNDRRFAIEPVDLSRFRHRVDDIHVQCIIYNDVASSYFIHTISLLYTLFYYTSV